MLGLGLPDGDYALFGSGPLLVRGWISEVGDLDVIARGPAWDKALSLGRLQHLSEFDVDIVEIGSTVTVGTSWGIGTFSTNGLIDGAEIINHIPCVRLVHVAAYKRIADRAKDRVHLQIIQDRSGLEGMRREPPTEFR